MTEQKNKLAEYQEKKDKILRMLEEIQIQIGDNELKDAIVQKQTKLKNDRFVVSVFGHFSNGKSTFLNALMGFGEEILTEDDAASTATITRLRYASEDEGICNKAEIEFSSGNTERVGIKDLGEYVARNNSREVETTIKQVILYLNSELLKNGVEIVDTPGFNSTYKMHTETALRQVEESDAAIFLFNCENPGKTPEIEFLKKIQKYMDRVFFLMNKYEKSNSQGKEEMEDLKRKLKQQEIDMAGKEIYPISALEARKGIAERNEALREHSNMDKFKSVLEDYLVSDENVTDRLLAPLTSIRGTLGQYKNRAAGEVADIALLLWNPAGAAGTAGKVLKTADTAKDALTAGKLIEKSLIVLKKGQSVVDKVKDKVEENCDETEQTELPTLLDCLSLGFWAEKVGGMIGEKIKPTTHSKIEDEEWKQQYLDQQNKIKEEINSITSDIRNREAELSEMDDYGKERRIRKELDVQRRLLQDKKDNLEKMIAQENEANKKKKEKNYYSDTIDSYLNREKQNANEMIQSAYNEFKMRLVEDMRCRCQQKIEEIEDLLDEVSCNREQKSSQIDMLDADIEQLKSGKEDIEKWLSV